MLEHYIKAREEDARTISEMNFHIGWLQSIVRRMATQLGQEAKVADILSEARQEAKIYAQSKD